MRKKVSWKLLAGKYFYIYAASYDWLRGNSSPIPPNELPLSACTVYWWCVTEREALIWAGSCDLSGSRQACVCGSSWPQAHDYVYVNESVIPECFPNSYRPDGSSLSNSTEFEDARLNSGRESLEGGLWSVEKVSGRGYGLHFCYS